MTGHTTKKISKELQVLQIRQHIFIVGGAHRGDVLCHQSRIMRKPTITFGLSLPQV